MARCSVDAMLAHCSNRRAHDAAVTRRWRYRRKAASARSGGGAARRTGLGFARRVSRGCSQVPPRPGKGAGHLWAGVASVRQAVRFRRTTRSAWLAKIARGSEIRSRRRRRPRMRRAVDLGFVRHPGRGGLVERVTGAGWVGQDVFETAHRSRIGPALGFIRSGARDIFGRAAGRDGGTSTSAGTATGSSGTRPAAASARASAWSALRVRSARQNSAMAASR